MTEYQKIGIVGAGAMGSLYGGMLSQISGCSIFLIDPWEAHVKAIGQNGLTIERIGAPEMVCTNLNAVTDADKVGVCDLAIIFVKSTLTGTAIRSNRAIFGDETVVLTLQNGLGNIEQIESNLGARNIIAGTTAQGATLLEPGRIRHAGTGKTIIGELDGHLSERLAALKSLLDSAGADTDLSENVIGLIWDKLLVNVGINALTAITRQKNGRLPEFEEIDRILESAVLEGMAVARKKGIQLGYEDAVAHARAVCAATAANKSSMLQDILNGRQTEIEAINGAILKEGAALGVETPVNAVLYGLIKFFERGKSPEA
jgi:2-dehydropantoate 2-reductase